MSAPEREPTSAELALLEATGFRHHDHLGWLDPDGAQVSDDGSLFEALQEAYASVELRKAGTS